MIGWWVSRTYIGIGVGDGVVIIIVVVNTELVSGLGFTGRRFFQISVDT